MVGNDRCVLILTPSPLYLGDENERPFGYKARSSKNVGRRRLELTDNVQ
jgi:hypothetical protein